MSDEYGKIIEGHEYDGIKELDNPLPRWWLNIFYATIVFAIGYWAYYELLGGPSHDEQLAQALQETQQVAATQEPMPSANEVDVTATVNNPAAIQDGQTVFAQMCASCHGQKGEGMIGPNLTDKYWMHSKGDFEGVLLAIRNGFPDKGMPPWGGVIPPEKHAPLAAFVLSLKGTNPPNAKAPQGDMVE